MCSSLIVLFSLFAAAARAGKRGLAWPYYNSALDPGLFNTTCETVAIYDWETYAPVSTDGSSGLGFIGTQRCIDCNSSPITNLQSRSVGQRWQAVFTLNEPDVNSISPSQAAIWYLEHINPLPLKKVLPAVTSSSASGKGINWLTQMISACESSGNCSHDYCNLHWYGASFSEFQSYVESAHSQLHSCQLMITEFALQNPPGGQADQVSFFQQAFAFLDGASYVELYFPFVATSPSLLQQNDPNAASYVGTGSCLYNNDGTVSAVGELMF